ncbi:MAG TPA: SIS domain-containing protein [Devosia sp.]|nr:SIS domain-containing protein [Devosia sp.]
MRLEIEEIPEAARRLLAGAPDLETAGRALRESHPLTIVTIARGSSDHAASFLKYAIELVAGIPVASIGPSIMSVYGRELRLERCAAIAISQSGKSPDIVSMTQSAKRNGALTISLTNTAESALAEAGDVAIALKAGKEQSVAATKSFVNSIVAGLAILAYWQGDQALLGALRSLPDQLAAAISLDWSPLLNALSGHNDLYVLGRGPGLAIAAEAALKFKETCGIHAEAYSSAEVLHGPARILENGFPVLALAARDAAESGIAEIADRLAAQGATVLATTLRTRSARSLPFVETGHPVTDALVLIGGFYAFVECLSRQRGFDPDRPPHLRKITETV